MTTIEEVARLSGVSTATVSRALRGLPNVAPSTRARVLRVAEELNYALDVHASRLASGRTMTIGLVTPMAGQWFFSQITTAVEAVVLMRGYDVLRYPMASPEGQTAMFRQLLTGNRIDGLIVSTISLTTADIALLRRANIPVITVETRTAEFPSITCDNTAAACIATEHLIELGHRRIGLLGGIDDDPMGFTIPPMRRAGYKQALHAAGIPLRDDLIVSGNFSAAGGAEAMAELLSMDDPPSAVFAMSDEMAIGALKTLRDAGVRVPQDMSVVGFDDHHLSAYLDLTTIQQPVADYGEQAALTLLRMLANQDGNRLPDHRVFAASLVVRGTTGPHPSTK